MRVRPRYGEGSLADLLPSVFATLGVPGAADPLGFASSGRLAGARRVAVLLVDGLGHEQLPLAVPLAPTLADLDGGELTAGFPSTTPTSLVTLGTGTAPGAHGILGFTLRLPGTPHVLNHIEWRAEPDPALWQPEPTQFERAAEAGVAVSVIGRPVFAGSGLTIAAYRGATFVGAEGPDAVAEAMLAALGAASAPALVYGYLPDVDRAGHETGVDSPGWREAVVRVERVLARLVEGLPPDAALVVTADHGQLDVPDSHRIDLDADPRLRAGVEVVAGEPRVRYLHTVPGAVDDVLAAWLSVLGPAAWVATRDEVVEGGWFGPVREAHLDRIGDVVVVCHDRYAIFASRAEPPQVARLVGYHGSYTPAEMRVPLLVRGAR